MGGYMAYVPDLEINTQLTQWYRWWMLTCWPTAVLQSALKQQLNF